MAWLRIDDRFVSHPKVRGLTDRRFRVWMRVLCKCAQHGDGTVDKGLINEVSDLGPSTIRCFIDAGLLDLIEGSKPPVYEVHNWLRYQPKDPTGAERSRDYRRNKKRDENRDGNRDANGPSRAGTRAYPSRPVDLNPPPPVPALQDVGGQGAEEHIGEENTWNPYPVPPTAEEWAKAEPEPIASEVDAELDRLRELAERNTP